MNNQYHDNSEPPMRDEYDFTGKVGIRGKYAAQLRNGYPVVIHHADGTTTSERHLPATMIALDPDVQAFFPMPMRLITPYAPSSVFLPTAASSHTVGNES